MCHKNILLSEVPEKKLSQIVHTDVSSVEEFDYKPIEIRSQVCITETKQISSGMLTRPHTV